MSQFIPGKAGRIGPLAIAAVLALGLAACKDEKKGEATAEAPPVADQPAPEPAPPAPPAPEKSASETALEGLDKLREAAGKAVQELQPTIDKARDAAQQAITDAQPGIDKAREAAKQLGHSVDQIVRDAQDHLKTATDALEKRLNELQAGSTPPTGDPTAVLGPAETLRADTRAAARAGGTSIVPAYVGVWAATAADCARIDRDPLESYAVITPTTIRRSGSVCNIAETPLTDNAASIDAQCIAEGGTEQRLLSLSLPSPDRLVIADADQGADQGAELRRCHLAP